MMNIRNLGSNKSVGAKYKDGIGAELCWKFWVESDCYFCNITESGWFWKRLSRNKVLKHHFVKSVSTHTQMFFKIGVSQKFRNMKTPVLKSLFKKVAGLKVCNLMRKILQHRSYPVNIAKFLRTTFFIELFLLLSAWLGNCYWASADLLFLIKNTIWHSFY